MLARSAETIEIIGQAVLLIFGEKERSGIVEEEVCLNMADSGYLDCKLSRSNLGLGVSQAINNSNGRVQMQESEPQAVTYRICCRPGKGTYG